MKYTKEIYDYLKPKTDELGIDMIYAYHGSHKSHTINMKIQKVAGDLSKINTIVNILRSSKLKFTLLSREDYEIITINKQ